MINLDYIEEVKKEVVCAHCGKTIEASDDCYVDIIHGGYYCTDCITVCDDCERFILRDDAEYLEKYDKIICHDCRIFNYCLCDDCGEYVAADECQQVNYRHVCNNCLSNNYVECRECGDWIHLDDAIYVDEEYYCSDCAPTDLEDYNHTRSNLTFRLADGQREEYRTRFFGIELETDDVNDKYCDSDLTDIAVDVKGYFAQNYIHAKRDGSLDNGIEFVTEPSTWEYLESQADNIQLALNCIYNYDMRSHDTSTCGLHCHVNKRSFSDWEKSTALMILWLDKNWDNMVKFSRRNHNSLEQWAKKNEVPEYIEAESITDVLTLSNCDRYNAINIRNNATIEFRMFRGTLNYKTLSATIELVKLLCEWAEHATLEQALSYSIFDITKNASENLQKYLMKRGIN